MRRWIPRRPSPALERRLFRVGPPDERRAARLSVWTWWAPALGCLMVALVVLNERAHSPLEAEDFSFHARLDHLSWSNQDLAAYVDSRQHSDQNAPPIFKWTSHGPSASSNGSFLLLETNGLVR
jgi:hypothetical protein